MKTPARVLILLGVIVVAAGTVYLKNRTGTPPAVAAVPVTIANLPRLLDLGADKCVPCKLMAPILADLKKEYAGRMTVEFIDVWKDADAGKKYGVEMIPTQIFFDAEGRELFRHTGFFGKEDILAKWKELGARLP
ncbi:MAG: thioredoxin family protein [Luteolibacter sp.]